MASQVRTMVVAPPAARPEVYNLILRLPPVDTNLLFQRLSTILVTFRENQDVLSRLLLIEGVGLLEHVAKKMGELRALNRANAMQEEGITNELLQGGIEKVVAIRQVLKNPHSIEILHQPQLINGLTLELEKAQEYARLKGIGHFPHQFAKAMSDWFLQLPRGVQAEVEQQILRVFPPNAEVAVAAGGPDSPEKIALDQYDAMASTLMKIQGPLEKQLQRCIQLAQSLPYLEQMNAKAMQQNAVVTQRIEASMVRQVERIETQAGEIRQGRAEIGALKVERIKLQAECNQRVQQVEGQLQEVKVDREQIREENKSLEQRVAYLNSCIGNYQAQINGMQNQGGGGGCAIL